MAKASVARGRDAFGVAELLSSPEIVALVADLEQTRWTGRPGYPIRSMVGIALVKSMYCLPTWTRTVRLVAEHASLRRVLGTVPSVDACYRFSRKLREHGDLLGSCVNALIAGLQAEVPGLGTVVAIDGSDLPAYANGQRYVSAKSRVERKRFADPDASWGHRSAISTRKGGGFYGYKVHAAVDVASGLPIAWKVETASASEIPVVPTLLDSLMARDIVTDIAVLDRGYDQHSVYDACESRGVRPVVPLRETLFVKAGKHLPRECSHGTWTFAGSDAKRGASKWRCPSCECRPASEWVKADRLHPLIPRTSARFKALYHQRGAVEREFGRLV